MGFSCTYFRLLPVHLDLPVGSRGQGDPSDLPGIVILLDSTEDHHAAFLTVAKAQRGDMQHYASNTHGRENPVADTGDPSLYLLR